MKGRGTKDGGPSLERFWCTLTARRKRTRKYVEHCVCLSKLRNENCRFALSGSARWFMFEVSIECSMDRYYRWWVDLIAHSIVEECPNAARAGSAIASKKVPP